MRWIETLIFSSSSSSSRTSTNVVIRHQAWQMNKLRQARPATADLAPRGQLCTALRRAVTSTQFAKPIISFTHLLIYFILIAYSRWRSSRACFVYWILNTDVVTLQAGVDSWRMHAVEVLYICVFISHAALAAGEILCPAPLGMG